MARVGAAASRSITLRHQWIRIGALELSEPVANGLRPGAAIGTVSGAHVVDVGRMRHRRLVSPTGMRRCPHRRTIPFVARAVGGGRALRRRRTHWPVPAPDDCLATIAIGREDGPSSDLPTSAARRATIPLLARGRQSSSQEHRLTDVCGRRTNQPLANRCRDAHLANSVTSGRPRARPALVRAGASSARYPRGSNCSIAARPQRRSGLG